LGLRVPPLQPRNPSIAERTRRAAQDLLAVLAVPTATGHDSTACRPAPRPVTPRIRPGPHHCPSTARTWSAAGNGRDHPDLGPCRYLGVEPVREPDVLLADVDVDETPQLPALVENPAGETGVRRVQLREDLAESSPLRGDLGGTAGVGAQDGGDADRHAHGTIAFLDCAEDSSAANASRVGRIGVCEGTDTAVASRVLSPSPELMMTVSASGSSCPDSSSLRVVASVTPTAVSPKMPSVAASSRIASTISSSPTSATAPPVRRVTSRT